MLNLMFKSQTSPYCICFLNQHARSEMIVGSCKTQRSPVPQKCVYILICVMELLDKVGSSAASGEKGRRSGLTASNRSGRHLLAAEDTHINGSSVSLQWCCHSMFSPLWALGGVNAESASYENRKLVPVIPSLLLGLSPLALCLELSGWDGVRAPVRNLRQHQRTCFRLTCGGGLNTTFFEKKTPERHLIPTKGPCQQNILRGQGNIIRNKEAITFSIEGWSCGCVVCPMNKYSAPSQ